MLEDEWLKLKFKAGSRDALRQIYEKYRDRLLTLALADVRPNAGNVPRGDRVERPGQWNHPEHPGPYTE